jgi:hypothetical protein
VKNLLDGTVTEIKDNDVRVMVPDLEKVFRIILKKPVALKISQHVTIGVRPEHVHVTAKPDENTCLLPVSRIVEDVTSANCRFHTNCSTDDTHQLEASLRKYEGQSLENGQSYYVTLPPDRMAIILD